MLLPNSSTSYPVKPIWKQHRRIRLLNTKRPELAGKISMSWRDEK